MFAGRSKAEMRRMVGMFAYEIERFYASLLSKGSCADKVTMNRGGTNDRSLTYSRLFGANCRSLTGTLLVFYD